MKTSLRTVTKQQCTQRSSEEKEKTEAAHAGLAELGARTVARLEGLGQLLKDRQSTVLAMLKHEREVGQLAVRSLAWSGGGSKASHEVDVGVCRQATSVGGGHIL